MNETKFLDRINSALNDFHDKNTSHKTLHVRIDGMFECYDAEFIVYYGSEVLYVVPEEITKYEMIDAERDYGEGVNWDDYLVEWKELSEEVKEKMFDKLTMEIYKAGIPDNGEPFTVCEK